MKLPNNTSTFEYTNPHPSGKKNLGDCVFRALSIASDKTWLETYDTLTKLGRVMIAPPNDMTVVRNYMDKIALKINVMKDGKRLTAKDIALNDKSGTYVIRTASHLATVKEGKLRDTWDSSNKSAYIIWKVK